ncbi:hypothetical protein B0T16DRAFT_84485 [Cercophora newfieldiana]|uniref:Uncharacterized protein n=1 Tax=Cercophora newfieldiana TaxID=92897 RepID=A0AA39YFH4_9PEZI|nr:hypothetical protein B0T16DRAFT_84485 [Cercophora newfieldiana]
MRTWQQTVSPRWSRETAVTVPPVPCKGGPTVCFFDTLVLLVLQDPINCHGNFQSPAGRRATLFPSCLVCFSFGSLQRRSLASLGQAWVKKVSSWTRLGSGGIGIDQPGLRERGGFCRVLLFNPLNPYPGLVSGLPCRHHFRALVIRVCCRQALFSVCLPERRISGRPALRCIHAPSMPFSWGSSPNSYISRRCLSPSSPRSFPSAPFAWFCCPQVASSTPPTRFPWTPDCLCRHTGTVFASGCRRTAAGRITSCVVGLALLLRRAPSPPTPLLVLLVLLHIGRNTTEQGARSNLKLLRVCCCCSCVCAAGRCEDAAFPLSAARLIFMIAPPATGSYSLSKRPQSSLSQRDRHIHRSPACPP